MVPNMGRLVISDKEGQFWKNENVVGYSYRIDEDIRSEIVSAQLLEDTGISKRKSGLLSFFLRTLRFLFELIRNGQIW